MCLLKEGFNVLVQFRIDITNHYQDMDNDLPDALKSLWFYPSPESAEVALLKDFFRSLVSIILFSKSFQDGISSVRDGDIKRHLQAKRYD